MPLPPNLASQRCRGLHTLSWNFGFTIILLLSIHYNRTCEGHVNLWRYGVVVITTAQLHSTKPELKFCAGSNPARGVSEIRDGEDLWQWSQLEIRLNAFSRSTIPQKQFIIKESCVQIFVLIASQFNKNAIYSRLICQNNWKFCQINEHIAELIMTSKEVLVFKG